ncbi:MAG TPA: hypothetical protein VLH81_06895 [Desulfobacterales bacterium]|nr:hypothetical protein [Desulfobacterales bacterium]
MRNTMRIVFAILVVAVIVGCAPGPNAMINTPDARGSVPGFWQGLWNGMIAPITFIISLFNRNVRIYEVHNNGGWYDFGFIFGLMIAFGGGAGGAASRRRRHD